MAAMDSWKTRQAPSPPSVLMQETAAEEKAGVGGGVGERVEVEVVVGVAVTVEVEV